MSIPAIIMRRYFVEKKEKLARRECGRVFIFGSFRRLFKS